MHRSRSPRVLYPRHVGNGQVSHYPPLSAEARLLQRLAEPELPPGATDTERAAARAEAAAGVEHASKEMGGHWAEAYQELRPDWQPTPTDIEVSNQRAAELTAARAEIAQLQAAVPRSIQLIQTIRRDNMFFHDDYGASIPLEALETHIPAMMNLLVTPQPVTRPFSGEGRRLDE